MADKLKMHSPDLTQGNIAKIREHFPGCVTEAEDKNGHPRLVVDFDQLRQELSGDIVEGPQERYQLNWPGKRQALLAANAPIVKTLRPCPKDSVAFDTTRNLFIEGDNLEALKLLQKTYLGQVKMIYIDPPYNVDGDSIYKDDFKQNVEEYMLESNQKDSNGNRFSSSNSSNGRFHSDWLSSLYSRIRLSKKFLREDGVIIISISDKEFMNLKHLCDEVFGEVNHIATIVWNSTKSVTNSALISVGHTYNLIYARNKQYFVENRSNFRLPEDGSGFENPDNDPRGAWKADPFQVGGWRPNQQYVVTNPNTGEEYKPNPGGSWKNDHKEFKKLLADNKIVFGVEGESGPQRKRFLSDALKRGKVSKTWWDDVGTTTNGTARIKKLFSGKGVFSNPKPVDLIMKFIQLGDHTGEGVILDFYAGSATTAEAVMRVNAEKNTSRRYVLVQAAEKIDAENKSNEHAIEYLRENSLPLVVSSISRARIKLSGSKLQEEYDSVFDTGFRAFKIDTSNMAEVYYTPGALKQKNLSSAISNIKPGRDNPEDLLFQVLVDRGIDLTLPIESKSIQGKTVFFVNGENYDLVACFDADITRDLIKELAGLKPVRAVFRDGGFSSDSDKINASQLFRQLSPETDVKSI